MKEVRFFSLSSFFTALIISGLFTFVACNKVDNALPEKVSPPSVVLPKLEKSGPQDSIPEQESYRYNAQGQLEQIKGIFETVTTFSYTNGLLTSKKVVSGSQTRFERQYFYQNGNLTSYKDFYAKEPDTYLLLEIAALDANGFPSKITTTTVTPTTQTWLKTLTYIWKNGNVQSVDMQSIQCNQSAEMEYDDKITPWHQFQNPLKNPHFLDDDIYTLGKFYSKNNETKANTPHCSNSTTSYTYNNLGLPTTSKLSLTGSNNFTWLRTYIHKYQ